MSLRGVWIYKPDATSAQERILFSRRFPVAECKMRRLPGYIALCDEQALCTAVFSACGLSERPEEYTGERDSCLAGDTKPLYEVGEKKHWPLVAVMRHSLLFCALPVVDVVASGGRPSAIELPGVTTALDVIEQIAAHLGPGAKSLATTDVQINDLYNMVSVAMPFGNPVRMQFTQTASMLAVKPPPPTGKNKQPAWKPFPFKGNNRVTLALQERVKAAQYDREDITDVIEVTGDIRCRGELESNPELSIGISTPANSHPVTYLLVHPCVQSSEAHPVKQPTSPRSTSPLPAANAAARTRKMTLHPPPDLFTLCQYRSDDPPLPIRGFYQMKGDSTVKLLVQLKLVAGVKNSFDFCELRIPFFHRGPVSNVEFHPSTSQVSIASDHRTLVWNIGQKFPSRTLETQLTATVSFQDDVSEASKATSMPAAEDAGKAAKAEKAEEFVEDPFCVGLNTYAELNFRILDYTLSGCFLDPKAVSLYPNSRFKLTMSRELVSDGYKIWNSHGDARVAQGPPARPSV